MVNIKTINMTNQDIIKKAKSTDAVGFEKWLSKKDLSYEWLEVNLGDLNDGEYCIVIENPLGSAEFLDILFMDGKFQND
jgi:hypothetical protein